MSIFLHMTSGKTFATFLTLHFRRMPLLLFYGYNKINIIHLCGDVFDLYIKMYRDNLKKKTMCQWI